MDEAVEEVPDLVQETPPSHIFIPPSIHGPSIVAGESYTHLSPIPSGSTSADAEPYVLGVDEAGRGPVLGPMVYGVFYLPASLEGPLLKAKHGFMDSKALTPTVRSNLMCSLCTPQTDLHSSCGWATRVMSARDISAGMLRPGATYNLNAQAMDATIELIQQVLDAGVNVREIYVDTIGAPAVYQKQLERVFPAARVTVAKKADALYPCVSAASVCAKVTRDAALEASFATLRQGMATEEGQGAVGAGEAWGSGYPSDVRTTAWMKRNLDPMFGWGAECRFSWGTVKDMLDKKGAAKVVWPEDEDEDDDMKVSQYFRAKVENVEQDPLASWFGMRVSEEDF